MSTASPTPTLILAQSAGAVPSLSESPVWRAFSAVVDRIEAIVDAETAALRTRDTVDFAEISRRKRQGLLELSRSLPQLLATGSGAAARDRLGQLAEKLERNRAALDVQLKAVQEVSAIIELSLKRAESDGTYSCPMVWQ